MSRGSLVSDAELLRVLARLDPAEHEAAALAFGRERRVPRAPCRANACHHRAAAVTR